MSKQLYPESILVRLAIMEKHRIEANARKAGSSLSRFLVNAGLQRPMVSDVHREEIILSIFELNKVSKNLNDIAHSIYACAVSGEEFSVAFDAKKAVGEVNEVITILKKKLSC